MTLDFEAFKRYIEHIKAMRKLDHDICDAIGEYRESVSDFADFWMPSLMESDLVDLLSRVLDDEELLTYWIYDLDCGEEYEDGCVLDDNDQPIACRTVEELWDALHS